MHFYKKICSNYMHDLWLQYLSLMADIHFLCLKSLSLVYTEVFIFLIRKVEIIFMKEQNTDRNRANN